MGTRLCPQCGRATRRVHRRALDRWVGLIFNALRLLTGGVPILRTVVSLLRELVLAILKMKAEPDVLPGLSPAPQPPFSL